jgi:hypothetical protein
MMGRFPYITFGNSDALNVGEWDLPSVIRLPSLDGYSRNR